LGHTQARALLDYAIENQKRFEPTTIRTGAGKHAVDSERRSSRMIKDLGPFTRLLRERILQTLPAISAELGVPAVDPRVLEIEMVAHGEGAFYRRHNDMLGRSVLLSRRISMVYYFHRLPKAFTGGELRFYSLGGAEHVDIEPRSDRLVAFPSWAPHSVERVCVPNNEFSYARFALNIWIGAATEASP
jgi:Rps23 Pro-64 3,4-dihydroxylase Tpa1-like proline 4-hydroxylase